MVSKINDFGSKIGEAPEDRDDIQEYIISRIEDIEDKITALDENSSLERMYFKTALEELKKVRDGEDPRERLKEIDRKQLHAVGSNIPKPLKRSWDRAEEELIKVVEMWKGSQTRS